MGILALKIANRFRKIPSVFLFAGLVLCFLSCDNTATTLSLPFYNSPAFTPQWIDPTSDDYSTIHQIAPFEFLNQDSSLVNNQTFLGKIYVADFFFTTCPGICSKMTFHMSLLQDTFSKEENVMLASYSVMPWHDTPHRLQKFAQNHEAIPGKWHFLTGDKNNIYSLARRSYFVEEEFGYAKNSDEFLHSENFILIDQKGRIRGLYNGTLKVDVNRLIADIRTLLNE